jgi:predicted nucleic acid-binding protein
VKRFLDTSVILASLDPDEPRHAACDRIVAAGGNAIYVHALAEAFSILSGGRHGRRLSAGATARLMAQSVLPQMQTQTLSGNDVMAALAECESRGVRGGAIYHWLHLAAARKAAAQIFITLDLRDFQSLARPGDPHRNALKPWPAALSASPALTPAAATAWPHAARATPAPSGRPRHRSGRSSAERPTRAFRRHSQAARDRGARSGQQPFS